MKGLHCRTAGTHRRPSRLDLLTLFVVAEYALLILVVGTYWHGHGHYYHGQNAGVVVDAPIGYGCAGIEWRGTPGVYVYTDCGGL